MREVSPKIKLNKNNGKKLFHLFVFVVCFNQKNELLVESNSISHPSSYQFCI
jgi:hypothetical protein